MKVSLFAVSLLLVTALAGGCKTTSPSSGGSAGGLPSAGGTAGGGTPSPGGVSGGSAGDAGIPGGSSPGGASPGGAMPGGSSAGTTGGSSSGAGGAGGGRSVEEMDGELDESLEDFDDRVSGAGTNESGEIDILDPTGRNTGGVAASAPVFEEAEVGAGDAGGTGDIENTEIETRAEEGYESPGPAGNTVAEAGETFPVPEDVGDGQGDDIVLRQIREAAMREPDPDLREKLWDEYRRIKDER